jgi:ribonuclease E
VSDDASAAPVAVDAASADAAPAESGSADAAPVDAEGGEGQRDGRRRRRGRGRGRDGAESGEANESSVEPGEVTAAEVPEASAGPVAQEVPDADAPVVAPVVAAVAPIAEAAAPVEAAPVVAPAPVAVEVVAPAPAPAPAAPVVAAPFVLPLATLADLARDAGLEWVNSDAEKVAQVQAAIAAEPKPIHVPRDIKPVVLVDEGPLILVETRRDLSQVKLPFEGGDAR